MSTFGLVSLALVSPVSNSIIHNSPGIHLLKCESDHGIPLARYQWTSIAFHLKTQAPYYGINVFSDFMLSCPSSILSFSLFSVFLPSSLLSWVLLSARSALPSIVIWKAELTVLKSKYLELDTLILDVEFPFNLIELPFSYLWNENSNDIYFIGLFRVLNVIIHANRLT